MRMLALLLLFAAATADACTTFCMSGWFQYQLDLAATIDDVLQLSAKTPLERFAHAAAMIRETPAGADPVAAAIHVRTDVSPQIRTVSFASFALDCTPAANLALVNAAYDATPFLAGASPQDRIDAALHPESDVCRPAHPRAMRP